MTALVAMQRALKVAGESPQRAAAVLMVMAGGRRCMVLHVLTTLLV
jgi:hypothetical protein